MAARYSRAFMPLSKVKEKEFLSRPMGCKGIGFSFVRCKPGEGATYVIVTKCRKRYLSRSRETVRSFLTASASKCRKEPLSESARRFGGRWETTQNQTLSLWFWAPSRRRTFPWADGPFWATGFPIEERYRVGKKRERNRPCRVLSRKMCRFGGTSDLRILGKRNIVSPIQSDRSHPRRL